MALNADALDERPVPPRRLAGGLGVQSAGLLLLALFGAQLLTLYGLCGERARALGQAADEQLVRELLLLGRLADAGAPLVSADRSLTLWRSPSRPLALPDDVAAQAFDEDPRSPPSPLAPLGEARAAARTDPIEWRPIAPSGAGLAEEDASIALASAASEALERPAVEIAAIAHGEATLASVALAGGARLNALRVRPDWTDPWALQNWSALALTSLALVAVAFALAARVSAPLRRIGSAAAAFGHGSPASLELRGPEEARRAADAFNTMQRRVSVLLRERASMLSALGHDLRTPLTRLRLKAHLIDAEGTRERLLRDIDEIESLTESALELARGTRPEPVRRTDLAALARSVRDDLAETGLDIDDAIGDEPVLGLCRPDALRRALVNLVENGVRHGGRARVGLERGADGAVTVIVDDDGPGIPPARLEDVFEPFVRLDAARSRCGGAGLGLTLARTIAREQGGDVVLSNREDGLRARLIVPSA